jgi:endoglycosylceramidase
VQPSPGAVDEAYLAALANVTQLLAEHGAYSILDMHQDGLSTAYGAYDGIPRWLANLTEARHPYPWPYPDADSAGRDTTEACAQNFEEIYHDTHGGLVAWADAWAAFASG